MKSRWTLSSRSRCAAPCSKVRLAPVARRRRHRRLGLGVVLTIGLAGGGVAAAGQFLTTPGGGEVRHLEAPVTATRTGTATVDLGRAPGGADHLDIRLTCLTAGTFVLPDGASLDCSDTDAAAGDPPMTYTMPLGPGQRSFTIRTDPASRWELSATYATVQTTPWATNAAGLTYGAENYNGTPDLLAVIASNGKTGYTYACELGHPSPADPNEALAGQDDPQKTVHVPVYQPDGTTVIGEFLKPEAAEARTDNTPATPIAPSTRR